MNEKHIQFSGNKMAEQRGVAKLSQIQLAERLGTSQNVVSRYERGARIPKPSTMAKIASAIGCNPEDLCEPLEEMTDPQKKAMAAFQSLSIGDQYRALGLLMNWLETAELSGDAPTGLSKENEHLDNQ